MPLHAFPSLQSALVAHLQAVVVVEVHPPSCAKHLSSVQAMPSSHAMSAPRQAPLLQTSPLVHGLASLQGEPSGLSGFVQSPLFAGSQVPAAWQPSEATHTF